MWRARATAPGPHFTLSSLVRRAATLFLAAPYQLCSGVCTGFILVCLKPRPVRRIEYIREAYRLVARHRRREGLI